MGALTDHRLDQQFYQNAYAKVTFTRDDLSPDGKWLIVSCWKNTHADRCLYINKLVNAITLY